MSKRMIWIFAAGIVVVVTAIGFCQKARGGKGQPAIVQMPGEGYLRGWVKREGQGKFTFIDEKGKTIELTKGTKAQPLSAVRGEYKEYESSVMNQKLDDYDKYTKLMDWAKEHCLYEEVARNAESILRMSPANPDPVARENLKEAKDRLAALRAGPSSGTRTDWTMDDVQKVRFALLPTKGRVENMQVTFKKQVLQSFVNQMVKEGKLQTKELQRAFLQRPGTEQAQIIKTETGNQYQPDINIGKDPPQIAEYRKVVEPLLNRSCATAACHGSGNLAFKLVPRPAKAPEVYANFYSLDTYKGTGGALIDHGDPRNSLFLSFLLPAADATSGAGHPTKIVPVLRTNKDPRYRQVLDWIQRLPPQPIDEAIEGQGVSTQPAPVTETQ